MVTGGITGPSNDGILDSTEIYKEFDGWQLVPESLPTFMSRFGLAKLNDRIFIFGISYIINISSVVLNICNLVL